MFHKKCFCGHYFEILITINFNVIIKPKSVIGLYDNCNVTIANATRSNSSAARIVALTGCDFNTRDNLAGAARWVLNGHLDIGGPSKCIVLFIGGDDIVTCLEKKTVYC